MTITKEHCQHIITNYPETQGSNTKFLQRFYEQTCISRGIEITWDNIKRIMDTDYAPEIITRARRAHIEATEGQMSLNDKLKNGEPMSFEEIMEVLE